MTFRGFEQMVAIVGRRFAGCEFRNFDVGKDEHTKARVKALETAKTYAMQLKENVAAGRNLIIGGPFGTGKDHLAVSVIRVALGIGVGCVYVRGSHMFSQMRQHYCEFSTIVPDKIGTCDLLVISDIEPSAAGSSDFEERAFLELVDLRYRDMRPTIITSNISKREDMSVKLGSRSVDRLFQDVVTISTSWPTHRRVAGRGQNHG